MARLVFFPPPLAIALSPARFRAFLLAHGAPRSLTKLAQPLALARALFAARLDDRLADALDLLAQLASPAGRDALLDAAAAVGLDLGPASALGLEDLAAHVLASRASNGAFERVVARACIALSQRDPDVLTHERVAVESRRARDVAVCARDLRAELAERSLWADVWHHEDEDGAYHFALLHADAEASVVAVDASGPAARTERGLRYDRVRVDVAAGRLGITTRHPRDLRALASAVGRALFGDARFFSERPALSTRGIEALGSAGLAQARLPAPFTRARVIGVRKELGADGTLSAEGPHALAIVEKNSHLGSGYFSETTLRLNADRDGPLDVDVRLPGRIAFSDPRREGLAREALEGLGYFAPGALADDVSSLFPIRHAQWRLREAFGDASIDALVAHKALRRTTGRMVTAAELRAQGSTVVTFDVPGEPGVSYAIPGDPSFPPRDVTERDREVWALDLLKLAAIRAREMKLGGAPRVRDDGGSVVLGTLAARTTSLVFVAVLRAPTGAAEQKVLAKAIASEALPGHAVLLVPKGRAWGCGLFEVEYTGLLEGGLALVEEAVRLARLEDEIEPCQLTDAPLVVKRKTREVWFLGTKMELADSGYAMIEGLALRAGEIASGREVSKWISPAREDTQAAKATRPKVVRWMAASFAAKGKKVPLAEIEQVIVAVGKRGFRLGVEVKVI